ncbi:MAG: 2-phospho-L-lactate transferase [Dactylosporangium sp.]|nr:2-phospho-L-lactate transferase [Dactylosporangium sp.]NNJ60152.1 2-phospho-L-lactate transferase [Dactylosporangium sp.]
MNLVVLAGGVGGGRFLLGVRAVAQAANTQVTAIVNTGDDVWLHGLRICPDLDSVLYTLGGGADPARGWGLRDETWTVLEELAAYQAEPSWFGLGDRDLAAHLVRTGLLARGLGLSDVTEFLCRRWRPGVRLLPASDDGIETHVVVAVEGRAGETRRLHFQEWWIRHGARLPALRFDYVGAEEAAPAPGVPEAIAAADVVLIAPSNPVVSIGPILAVPGIREALRRCPAPIIGISPIISGAPVRGMADRCLAALGVPCSAAGVGELLGARRNGGLLDGWLVDSADDPTTVRDVPVLARPLWMTDEAATQAIVVDALALAHG